MSLLDDMLLDDELDMDDYASEGIRDMAAAGKAKAKDFAGAAKGAIKGAPGAAKSFAGDRLEDAKTGARAAKNTVGSKIDQRATVEGALTKATNRLNKIAKQKDGLTKLEAYEAKVKTESAKIGSAIRELAKLNKAVEEGKMDRSDAVRRAKPITRELANLCSIMKYGIIIKDKMAVTNEDLQTLTVYTKGLQAAIKAAKANATKEEAAEESFFFDFEEDTDMFAFESDFDFEMDFDMDVEEEEAAEESFGFDVEEESAFDIDSFLDSELF